MAQKLPADRVYLSQGLVEPCFSEDKRSLFYVKIADGRRSIIRQNVDSGLCEVITTEPPPSGGIGYGGGYFTVHGDTLVYAGKGGRLWSLSLSTGATRAITPIYEGVAAPAISPCGQFVVFLCEQDERCNVLLTRVDGSSLPIKLSKDPWYAFNPTFSPDGKRLAWQEWDELSMPWDEARVIVVELAQKTSDVEKPYALLPLPQRKVIAKQGVSYAAPQFSPDGTHLAYTSDESGWRSLWVSRLDGDESYRIETGPGEVGAPGWVPGQIFIRWANASTLYAIRRHQSRDELLQISLLTKEVRVLPQPWTTLSDFEARGDMLAFLASDPKTPPKMVTYDVPRGTATLRASTAVGLVDSSSLSSPSFLSWKTHNNEDCYGIFYPAVGAEDQKKPLIVMIHGGPTSERPLSWEPQAQFFATRGWHYLIVNHRGSTGFGRAFQDKLNGMWGVVDVQDARSGAEHLVSKGLADETRLIITGGSAGGYTTLMALTQDPTFWAAGVSVYGVGDLYELRLGSHRFEVNYEQGLIGHLPEAGPLWKERSPLTHAKKVKAPLLLFHGQEDKAVPYQQSVAFADAMKRQGVAVELVLYPDEGHGFVKEKNRNDFLDKMERFLDKYVLCRQG